MGEQTASFIIGLHSSSPNGFSDFQIQTEEPGKNFFLQVLNLGSGFLNHE
jgi:hypothetical protein